MAEIMLILKFAPIPRRSGNLMCAQEIERTSIENGGIQTDCRAMRKIFQLFPINITYGNVVKSVK